MSVSNSSDNCWWRVPTFRNKIPILPSGARVPQDRCAYTCMPWQLNTFSVYQRIQWEKATIGGGKRYHVDVNRYLDVLATFKHLAHLVAFWGASAGTLAASQDNYPNAQTSPMYLLALCSLSTALDIAQLP